MHFARVLTVAFSIVAAQSYTIYNVTVKPGCFSPSDHFMNLAFGDAVQFTFEPNPSLFPLVESTFSHPCTPKLPQGYVYNTSGAYVVTNPLVPVWMFQDGHCGLGNSTVFAINPTGLKQFNTFKQGAMQSA